MTWKSYTAVSGATVLAGWLASAPPANSPDAAVPVARTGRRSAEPPADIQEQATRLQSRLRGDRTYTPPQRNLFRFDGGGDISPDVTEGIEVKPERDLTPEAPRVDVLPQVPALTLSGIAEDQANGQVDRTAVLSTPSGVELVREGNELFGYRVARIESEAVELVSVADGSTRRLTLGR